MSTLEFMNQYRGSLGESVLPAKRIFSSKKEINKGMKERRRLALTMAGVIDRHIDDPEGLQASDFTTYQIFESGDLAFKLIDLENIKTSRVGYVPTRGIMSPAYIRLVPKNGSVISRFYYWVFYSAYLQNVFNGLGGGVRQNLVAEDLLTLPVPVLAVNEQAAICDFLDCVTTRIDKLITRKVRFIELLREKRQALITHAVTKGLDANVPMKSSGSASELKTPSHWHSVDFWTIAKQVSRTGMADEELMSVYLDRGVIPYSEGGGLVHKPSETLDAYQLVEPGNFVLNNQQAWRGSVGVSQYRGIVSPAYLVFRLSQDLDPSFANYQFRDTRFVEEMMLSSQGVGDIQRQIKWPLLRYAKVLLPPLEEQSSIVTHLDRATARIDTLITRTESSIDLLREHRAALITAAVTGKIDLRDAV